MEVGTAPVQNVILAVFPEGSIARPVFAIAQLAAEQLMLLVEASKGTRNNQMQDRSLYNLSAASVHQFPINIIDLSHLQSWMLMMV
jgi:hypothetical protein